MGDSDDPAPVPWDWRDLPRRERATFQRDLNRGLRMPNPDQAGLAVRAAVDGLAGMWRESLAAGAGALLLAVLVGTSLSADAGWLAAVVGLAATAARIALRRRRLRAALQANLEVVAGRTFLGPPDPEEALRLWRVIEREGWLRGTFREQRRPHRGPGHRP